MAYFDYETHIRLPHHVGRKIHRLQDLIGIGGKPATVNTVIAQAIIELAERKGA